MKRKYSLVRVEKPIYDAVVEISKNSHFKVSIARVANFAMELGLKTAKSYFPPKNQKPRIVKAHENKRTN